MPRVEARGSEIKMKSQVIAITLTRADLNIMRP